MRSSTRWGAAAFAAALLAGAAVAAGCAGSTPAERTAAGAATAHPVVDVDLDGCAGCHQKVTPRVAAEWRDSRHGIALVKCFVCHGSTGADFKARPQPAGCRSCHPAEWASVTHDGNTQSCFGCHPPHALHAQGKASPHAAPTAKEIHP